RYNELDNTVSTLGTGLLGLTVACARCHDHKYDPIPTADYYSLYGVFASSDSPTELPLIDRPENTPGYAEFEKQYLPKKKALEEHVEKQFALLSETARERAGDYLVHAATTQPDPLETAIFFLSLSPEDLRPQIVARWRRLLEKRAQEDDPVFGPWKVLTALPPAQLAEQAPKLLAGWRQRPVGARNSINPLVLEALAAAKLTDRASVARAYGDLLRRVYAESRKADAPPLTPERKQILELVTGPESPGYFTKSDTYYYMSRAEKDAFGGMRNELDVLGVHAGAPPRAMVLNDSEELHNPRIFVRGNAAEPGDAVPRRFLKVLAGERRRPFPNGSGRLDLAKAITDPAQPLAARVIVNRVWMHHFGEPLVQTPSDFGSRSTPPSHPEALDWLAAAFTAPHKPGAADPGMGWSLKRLHRVIVTSAAYRQASADRAACRTRDPENRLLWRAHRRRLEFEQMRDTLLSVSGKLDRTMGGRPLANALDPANYRRTVYSLVDRQNLPEVFRAFNFPQPDQSVERRPNTTVPQQALFGLNSPFTMAAATALVSRPDVSSAPTPE
ncbi:MAG TPA: DUF1553 domain-containing protein, partial [Armatimonadota bacterium]|nr:DUF1553 domain-containing protein [Armatimonadota bacterium]